MPHKSRSASADELLGRVNASVFASEHDRTLASDYLAATQNGRDPSEQSEALGALRALVELVEHREAGRASTAEEKVGVQSVGPGAGFP